ncbi:zinc transport system substrate-binding protein [Desulfotomaculum arcticum]|uniref:Zinc transport system substrate-binding protein n=1 Tax=Desulfotruncus arcticus DSM 17038 TaxID=1121424 RepID=A0A1I2U1Q7_9FIRM|nr:metal ABC transporter substrate-binding protein [Desulfotruncus arcticus]SFG68826.1 zinc transport system substrate-binding protein [Desulfotomaculum arcticum] [Desulfotruncus arcticus DSM 17038]
MKKKLATLILVLLTIFVFSGCSNNGSKSTEDTSKVRVVATIFPVADIINNIGGDKVEVSTLLPAGSSPHTFEATPEQLKQISGTQLFVKVGADLDTFADKLAEAGKPELMTLTLADKVDLLAESPLEEIEDKAGTGADTHSHHHHDMNPHFWLNPVLVKDCLAPEIADALAILSPEDKDYFQANLTEYCNKIDQLDQEIDQKTSVLKNRSFIAFHSSWCYFADRYNLEDITVEEFPGKEPSAKWIAGIIDLAKSKQAKAVLIEPQFSPKAAQVLADEIGIPVIKVDPLGAENITGFNSYLSIMRSNTDNLVKALQ